MTAATTSKGRTDIEGAALENFDIEIDSASGISVEEQREVIANIDAVAGKTGIGVIPKKINARRHGFLLPLFINITAYLVLAAGLYGLKIFYTRTDASIRSGGELFSVEGKLIEEIRGEFDEARNEINKLNSNLERATLFEWQMSGFYSTVNNNFSRGKSREARDTLDAMREFVDTPSFRDIPQIEERREINLAMIETMTRLIDESIRTSRVTEELNAASQVAENAVREKEAAETRAAALETELEAAQRTSQNTIGGLRNQNVQKDETISARERTITDLRTQTGTLQQTIAANEQRINTLQTQNTTLSQQLGAVRSALGDNGGTSSNVGAE
jgi:predicted  nucleic acid-binding Zn-ribbon protein